MPYLRWLSRLCRVRRWNFWHFFQSLQCERILCCLSLFLSQFSLDFCLQVISSLKRMSCNSPFFLDVELYILFHTTKVWFLCVEVSNCLSKVSFCCCMRPKTFLFQQFNWVLMNGIFCWNLWAAQPSVHHDWIDCLKDWCLSYMISNLNDIGPPTKLSVSAINGQWSEKGLGRPLRWVFGCNFSHSFDTKTVYLAAGGTHSKIGPCVFLVH